MLAGEPEMALRTTCNVVVSKFPAKRQRGLDGEDWSGDLASYPELERPNIPILSISISLSNSTSPSPSSLI